MRFGEVTKTIWGLCEDTVASFQDKAVRIVAALESCNTAAILDHLDYAGVIPERFDHDSTEEKLFAKYCDGLLARAWTELGLHAEVIVERADAPDVKGTNGTYTIVGDAKAFRLSRTAKNQKDFKVEALHQWRKGADYALLVAPLYQYPKENSQIYSQASRYKVTLLSYTHFAFLIRHKPESTSGLARLWSLAGDLRESSNATAYWSAVEKVMLDITGIGAGAWSEAVKATYSLLPKQAEEQIRFWEEEKKRIARLTQDEAIEQLVKALKIDSKIQTIRKNSQA